MKEKRQRSLAGRLAGLPAEVQVESIVSHAHCTELHIIVPPVATRICPKCQSTACVVKDSGRVRTVRHSPCAGSATLLTFRQRRYLCKECGSTYYEPIYWIHPHLSITKSLYMDILRGLNTPMSLRRIAQNCMISDSIVLSVLQSVPTEKPSSLPGTLCIDEFSGESGIYDPTHKRWTVEKFHCILADGDRGNVVDILIRMDKACLKPYFMAYPLHERQKVQHVCCDMHGGYISLAKECFPSAVICLDPFHVTRRVKQGLTDVRTRIQQALQRDKRLNDYKELKNASRLLSTAIRNQPRYWGDRIDRNRERIRRLLSLSPDLEEAYTCYQEFLFLFDEKMFTLQRAALGDWIRKYSSSLVPEVAASATSIRHFRNYFQNSLKYGKSNSVAEGRNRAIKEIKRNSYGQHSFENFRKRILLAFGPTHFEDASFTVFGEKRSQNDR